ncbi:MAG: dihydrofolate reductase family protein [Cyanobacteria bacterium J06639_18]
MKRITDSVIFLLLTTYKRFITSIARAEKDVFDKKLRKIKRCIAHLYGMKNNVDTPQNRKVEQNKEGAKRIYIDGGITIQRFLAEGLINDLTITTIPVILGSGKPLFGNLEKDILLRHIATKTFDFGFVQLIYEVEKNV